MIFDQPKFLLLLVLLPVLWMWMRRAPGASPACLALKCAAYAALVIAYTRDGALKRSSTGQVTTSDGLPMQGGFQPIPAGTTGITISSNGEVTTTSSSGNQNFQVQLVRFTNPSGLNSIGGNLYTESLASGTPETGTPGEQGYGTLQQGYLEMSNVKVVQEMVNMIVAQRAYEVNSKAVQSADEMMQESNNLRR